MVFGILSKNVVLYCEKLHMKNKVVLLYVYLNTSVAVYLGNYLNKQLIFKIIFLKILCFKYNIIINSNVFIISIIVLIFPVIMITLSIALH